MVTYRPKVLFQNNKSDREAWEQIANNPLLHRAIAFTQADMAMAGFGPQEMNGVNTFIVGLLNLSTDIEIPKALPVKALKSFDHHQPEEKK